MDIKDFRMDIKDFGIDTNFGIDIDLVKENEKKLNDKFENIIHIRKVKRNNTKYITIVENFDLDKEEAKKFISMAQKVINSSGSFKIDKESNEKKKVFIFNGDVQELIKKTIIEEYKIDENKIKFNG